MLKSRFVFQNVIVAKTQGMFYVEKVTKLLMWDYLKIVLEFGTIKLMIY